MLKAGAMVLVAVIIGGVIVWVTFLDDDPQSPPDEPAAAGEAGASDDSGQDPGEDAADDASADSDGSAEDAGVDEPDEKPTDDSALRCAEAALAGIQPDSLLVTKVEFEVTGVGGGASYAWNLCGDQSAGGDVLYGNEGTCAFQTTDFIDYLILSLTSEDAAIPLPSDVFFTASVHVHEAEYVSIGHDQRIGITTGGLSTGGPSDGSRGGEQWTFEGGSMGIGEATDITSEGPISGRIEATWGGPSTETFSGDEATAGVSVTCEFMLRQ